MTHTTTPATRPTSTVSLDPDDPRALFSSAASVMTALIDGTDADQLSDPTPCSDYDVRALLAHVVMAVQRAGAAARDVDPAQWPEEPTVVDDWLALWNASAAETMAAWSDVDVLDRPTRLPWGEAPGRDVLGMYTNEVVVHGWDLAQATNQQLTWDDRVVEASLVAVMRDLPAEGRVEMFESFRAEMGEDFESPFAAAIDLDEDAPLIDRLVAWNGRKPL